MEHIKTFLDSSTIHGLSWISTTRRWSRLFWLLIVIGGFSGAGYLIHASFYNWELSPISTAIETLPISHITFPNVTVCPPKNSTLNLNHVIEQSKGVILGNNTRNKLINYAMDVIQEEFYKEVMKNLSKVEDPNRYHNWYHGYAAIEYPYYKNNQLRYEVSTIAIAGNLTTRYFGEKFDAEKVDGHIKFMISIDPPFTLKADGSSKIILNIQKNTIKDHSENDEMTITNNGAIIDDVVDADLTYWTKNITTNPYDDTYRIWIDRKVSFDDIRNMELDFMPGFRLIWNYNKIVEPFVGWNGDKVKQFVR